MDCYKSLITDLQKLCIVSRVLSFQIAIAINQVTSEHVRLWWSYSLPGLQDQPHLQFSDIRYEGILYTNDTHMSTVALAKGKFSYVLTRE